ncbi:MAG: hypothetical protein ACR2QH_17775 [Geminicoccaceae bacterium]
MTQPDLLTRLSASETSLDALRDRLSVRRSFSTRTGTIDLIRPTESEGPPLMIKQSPQWSAAHTRGMWITLELLRSHADQTGLAPFAATPHNWGSDPAYICVDWVEGKDLTVWFAKTFADCELNEAFRRSLEMSSRYASLLAHYHRAMSDTEMLEGVIPKKAETIEQAGLAVFMIAMLRGNKGVRQSERVRSICDPGPHNAIEAPDGSLWLIDLPAHLETVMVERDIARLVGRQVGAVRKFTTSWIPRLGHYRRIVDAVIDGYESVGSPKNRLVVDRALVYACLATDAALKTARTFRRLAPGAKLGAKLEAFVRELLATILLGAGALWLRFRQPAPQQQSRRTKNPAPKASPS